MANKELLALFVEDQEDRKGDLPAELPERDRKRRRRVDELIATGALTEPEDYFHAAMVFQHGETLDDYWRAHELARKGADLGHRGARWLAAAAYDRWLLRQGRPQKYGTQYVPEGERWRRRRPCYNRPGAQGMECAAIGGSPSASRGDDPDPAAADAVSSARATFGVD